MFYCEDTWTFLVFHNSFSKMDHSYQQRTIHGTISRNLWVFHYIWKEIIDYCSYLLIAVYDFITFEWCYIFVCNDLVWQTRLHDIPEPFITTYFLSIQRTTVIPFTLSYKFHTVIPLLSIVSIVCLIFFRFFSQKSFLYSPVSIVSQCWNEWGCFVSIRSMQDDFFVFLR